MIGIILVFLVAIHLSVGMIISLMPISQRKLGEKFFRFIGTICLSLLALAEIVYHGSAGKAAVSSQNVHHWMIRIADANPWLWLCGLHLLAYTLSLPYRRYAVSRLLLFLCALCGLFALASLASGLKSQAIPESLGMIVFPLDLFLSALALGSAMTCMILGHWYLVDPGMSVRPLKILAASFVSVVSARFLLSSYTAILFWRDLVSTEDDPLSSVLLGNLLFFGQRVVFGLVLPLALSWMIWQTVKIRSTQSATGILYVAVVFVLFGELLSHYILVSMGYPI